MLYHFKKIIKNNFIFSQIIYQRIISFLFKGELYIQKEIKKKMIKMYLYDKKKKH